MPILSFQIILQRRFLRAHDPVLVKVSAVSVGDGGTRAEVAEGDLAKLPTISIKLMLLRMVWSLNVPPSKAVTVFGTEELPIAVDIRGRLKDTNEDFLRYL